MDVFAKFFSKRGYISLPYGSIDKKDNLIKNKPIEYITLPLGKHLL